jgi:toxin ParE1/3/4
MSKKLSRRAKHYWPLITENNMARIIRAPEADQDAAEIFAYIARDNIDAATQLLLHLDQVMGRLSELPLSGKAAYILAPSLRFVPVGAYLVFYRPMPNGIEVARILHGARDIEIEFSRD